MVSTQGKIGSINLLISLLVLFGFLSGPALGQIAVIVHPGSEIEDISGEQLKRLYLGSTTNLANGQSVYLMENGSLAKQFYKTVLDMSVAKFRKYWMKLVFSGEYAQPPDPFSNAENILKTVSQTEGAICFIDTDVVTKDVKVVSIDGLKPGEDQYLFTTLESDKLESGDE